MVDVDVRSPHPALTLALAALVHSVMLLQGTFRATYDAYVHIFLADHYARDWFSTWDSRWYTGFPVTSYPPGAHQLTAAISGLVGLEWAYAAVQLAAVLVLVLGVYRFSRLWVSEDAARWAALLSVLSPSLAEAVHVFGQLPTTAALGLLLNATPSLVRWLDRGCRRDLGVAVATLAATTACHHVTTLFGSVFFIGPLVARSLLAELRVPADGEPTVHPARIRIGAVTALGARRVNRLIPLLVRTTILAALLFGALVTVVLPYWLWSHADPIVQVPIPHASRDSFLANPNAGLVFWAVPWAWMAILLPAIAIVGLRPGRWPLAASGLFMAVLGTGGTTPIPRLLLGGTFDILTLDRFTFWATIIVLPIVGELAATFAGWIMSGSGRDRWRRQTVAVAAALLIGASFLFAASLTRFRTFQPDPVDPNPVGEFLAKDAHDRWRYLLLGLGDQMAWISANTTAETVDGNYHSARRLPDLVTHSVERLEGAKFRGMAGIGSLQQILTTPARYHLKFVFNNDTFYDPLLFSRGWNRTGTLRNGLVVWERGDIPPLPERDEVPRLPPWQRLLWGLLPPATLLSAAAAQALEATGLGRGWSCGCNPVGSSWFGRLRSVLLGHAQRIHLYGTRGARARPPGRTVPSGRVLARWTGFTALTTLIVVAVALDRPETDAPEATVVAYYDDIDFDRLERAWERLHPARRATLDQFLLDRSVQDGLLAGYAKLESIEVLDVRAVGSDDESIVEVDVQADYLTSLTRYRLARTHRLVRFDGRWFILPDPEQRSVPTDQFVRRVAVDYLDVGRRRPTTGATRLDDVLDRPRIEVHDARAVIHDGQWHLVGQLTNIDNDPAEVTVTGELLAADGSSLARQGAGPASVFGVLPGETAPFRIDFDRLLTRDDDPSFDPTEATRLQPDEPVTAFRLEVQALVTDQDLTRLPISGIQLDGSAIRATLHNPTLGAATVPVVWVAQHDDAGRVRWVDALFVEDAVASQHSAHVRLDLIEAGRLTYPAVEGKWFDTSDPSGTTFKPAPLFIDGQAFTLLASAFRRVP